MKYCVFFSIVDIYDRLWKSIYKHLLRYVSSISFILRTKNKDPNVFMLDYSWFTNKYYQLPPIYD